MDFCVSFLLSENECNIECVFDPLMVVINIFGGCGVCDLCFPYKCYLVLF